MSRAPRDLPVGFNSAEQVINAINTFAPNQRFSKLADLAVSSPAINGNLVAYAAQLAKETTRNVSIYRTLCSYSNQPVDEAWCAAQESTNNSDVLTIEKDIGKAASKMDREGQFSEMAKRIAFASEVGNVQDIHRFVQKQQALCNTPEMSVTSSLHTFDALLFAATWDDRDTPTSHTIAQPAARAESNATKNLLTFKEQRDGTIACTTEGAVFDLFAEARAAAILARILCGDQTEALNLILSFPLRHDRAQVGKLESIVQRWTTADRYAACVTLVTLAYGDREAIQTVINHSEFRVLLETAPLLLDAFNGVLMADFATVGRGIAYAESLARSDRFMRKHADSLIRLIRRSLVRQFVSPYKVVKLEAVAETFQMSVESAERLLADLIRKDEIRARIDLNQNLLYAIRQQDNNVHQAAIHSANEYVKDMHQALRLQALVQHKMFIPMKRKELTGGNDRNGGGGGGGGDGGFLGDDFDDELGGDDYGFGGGGGAMMMMGGGVSRFGGGGRRAGRR